MRVIDRTERRNEEREEEGAASTPAPPKRNLRPAPDGDALKAHILAGVSEMKDLRQLVFGNRLLVAKLINKKIGSLWIPPTAQNADRWEGKVGLVIAKGPACFIDDAQVGSFYGANAEIGDWVWFRASDGTDCNFRPIGEHDMVELRCLRDVEIAGVVPRPDFFF